MTSPDTTSASAAGNTDAPTASVPFGPSEIASYIVALAGLAASFFGQDFGMTKNAQALGLLITGLVTLGTSISRAIKHHGAMKANALTYAAQLQHVGSALQAGVNINSVAAGVSALNSAVVADTTASK